MARRTWPWIVGAIVVLLLACGGCALSVMIASALSPTDAAWRGGDAVAVINVTGAITGGSSPYVDRNVAYADNIKGYIEEAVENPSVRAIVVFVNSPGGGVVATVDIYNSLLEAPKPVVVSMGEMAASGGYYIACAADQIVAQAGTLTGSIGVIAQFIQAGELLEELGIQTQTIQTGPYKDQGGWHRPLTEEEVEMFQAIIDESYGDFVQAIVQGRNMPEDRVRTLADGRLFSGRQAVTLGLVDREGDLDDAIALAAEMGGIEGEPRIIRYETPPGLFDLLLSYASRMGHPPELTLAQELLGVGRAPQIMYIYAGP
ncbi:MAG: signal peptide peptidase SppA [Anaerolineae bacterium]|jgi:protease-4